MHGKKYNIYQEAIRQRCSIVEGDKLFIVPRSEYKYSIHKFYSIDDHQNYYNLALAHGKDMMCIM